MSDPEAINGGFHMAAVVIIAPMLGYNAKEYAMHRHPRNGINTLVYTALLGFEILNTWEHWYASQRNEDAT